MRTSICALLGALLSATALPAAGAELAVTLGGQPLDDPSSTLVTASAGATLLGLSYQRSLGVAPGLTAGVGLSEGKVGGRTYGADSDAFTTLRMGAVDLDVGWERPVGRLSPYGRLTGRAVVGALRVTDGLSDWTLADPADPTGQATLYEAHPERDVGVSVGVEATVGIKLRLGSAYRAVASAPTTSRCEGDAAPMDDAPTDAVATDAPPAEGDPSITRQSPSLVGAQSAQGDAPASDAATASAPVAAEAVAPAGAAPAPVASRDTPPRTRKDRRSWGLYLEGGYGVQSDLRFTSMGQLGLGGVMVEGGVYLEL